MNQYVDLLPDYNKVDIVQALKERAGYYLATAAEIQTLDMADITLVHLGRIPFEYDPTDTTSLHDGTTVLVSQDNRRYKSDLLSKGFSVLSRVTTPLGGEISGQAWLIIAPATGAFAGQENKIALYTLNGYIYLNPVKGQLIWVQDEDGFYRFNAAAAWVPGLGSFGATDFSSSIYTLDNPAGISVVDERNAPPGSPVDGLFYIVGTSPSGDYTGQNQKVALRRAGAWVFFTPYNGAIVFDQGQDRARVFRTASGLWEPLVEPGSIVTTKFNDTGVVFVDQLNRWTVTAPTADAGLPTNSNGNEITTFSHTAKDVNNRLIFDCELRIEASGVGALPDDLYLALFVNSETAPRDIVFRPVENVSGAMVRSVSGRLTMLPVDAAANTYRIYCGTRKSVAHTSFNSREGKFTLQEVIVT